jgi:hypothetical protein
LARRRFAAKHPDYLLDFLGFPWILSSESRLFNGLRGIKRGKFFLRPSLALQGAGTAAYARAHSEAQNCSWGQLTKISDSRQEIAIRAIRDFALALVLWTAGRRQIINHGNWDDEMHFS